MMQSLSEEAMDPGADRALGIRLRDTPVEAGSEWKQPPGVHWC